MLRAQRMQHRHRELRSAPRDVPDVRLLLWRSHSLSNIKAIL